MTSNHAHIAYLLLLCFMTKNLSFSSLEAMLTRRSVVVEGAATAGFSLLAATLNATEDAQAVLGNWGYPNGEIPLDKMMVIDFKYVTPYPFPGSLARVYLKPDAGTALVAMLSAYHSQTSDYLRVNEGYRTYAAQQYWWDYYGHNPQMAAPPGASNHGLGQAFDFEPSSLTSTRLAWVRANAVNYGYTGIGSEDWHFNFTGTFSGASPAPIPPTFSFEEREMYLVRRVTDGHPTLNGMDAAMGPGFFLNLGPGDLVGIARDLKIPDSQIIKGQEVNGGNGLPAIEFTRLVSLFQIPPQYVKPGGRYLAGGQLNN